MVLDLNAAKSLNNFNVIIHFVVDQIRKAVQEITGRIYKLGPYKLPEEKRTKDDVFSSFVNMLRASGVTVTEEEPES